MIETATGVVLRIYPFTETSLIVHWLTPAMGRLATVAKGARRPKSPLRGKLDLFYLADFSFNRSRRSELHTLREVTVRRTHSILRRELSCLQQAAYCAALVELATETETPLPAIFELLVSMLSGLKSPPWPQTVFAFEVKLLDELGLTPEAVASRLNDGARAVLESLGDSSWKEVPQVRLSGSQINEIGHFLQGFIAHHLGRVPKGREPALGSG